MSLLHYFSKDADKRARFIFNLIAPIYGIVDGVLEDGFSESIKLLKNEIDFKGKSIIDIGTGTGAWAAMFLNNGAAKVQGVDMATKMLQQSKKKHPDISFAIGNAEDLSKFENDSFDIVTASYLLHGVKSEKRAKMISEMKRISKQFVVIHDFVGKTPFFIRFLEFMEKSDYKNFKINFCDELKAFFPETKKIQSASGSGIYLAKK